MTRVMVRHGIMLNNNLQGYLPVPWHTLQSTINNLEFSPKYQLTSYHRAITTTIRIYSGDNFDFQKCSTIVEEFSHRNNNRIFTNIPHR